MYFFSPDVTGMLYQPTACLHGLKASVRLCEGGCIARMCVSLPATVTTTNLPALLASPSESAMPR